MSSPSRTWSCKCGQKYEIMVSEVNLEVKPTPAPSERPSVTEVELALKHFKNYTEVSQSGAGNKIVVRKKVDWLDPRDWAEIGKALEKFGVRWISDKENSRWEI